MGVAYITLMAASNKNNPHKHSCMGFFQSVYMFGIYYAPKACELITRMVSLNEVYLICSGLGLGSLLLLLFYRIDK